MMQLMEHPITRYSGKDETEYQYISKVLKRFVSINDIADMDDESIELLIAEIKGKMAFLFNGDRLTARQAAYKARLTSFTARLKGERKSRSQDADLERQRISLERRRLEHEEFKLAIKDKNRSLTIQAAKQARINKIFIGLLTSTYGDAAITKLMRQAQDKFSQEDIVFTDLSDPAP